MFSDNKKISEKQMERMLLLSIFASLVFVVPYLAANLFGEQMLWGMLCFLAMAAIYILLILWIEKKKPLAYESRAWIDWVHFARLSVRMIFYLALTYGILMEGEGDRQASGTSQWFPTIVPLLGICVYGAALRLEQQGRLYELLFWLLFIPFLFVLVFGIHHGEAILWMRPHNAPDERLIGKVCYLMPFLLPIEAVFVLRPTVNDVRSNWRLGSNILWTVLLALVISGIMVGIYGLHGASEEEMLTVAVLRCIRLPFQLSQRLDALLIWFYLVGCFVLISQTLFYERWLAEKRLRKLSSASKKAWILVGVAFLGSIGVSYLVSDYRTLLWMYCRYGMYVELPLSILLPVLDRR